MDFQDVDRRYADLRREHHAGVLSAEEFDARLAEMMVQDAEGRWWAKTRDGEWHYHDGRVWIRADPPRAETEPAVPQVPGAMQASATATTATESEVPAPVPPEIQRWNWGAFLLNWIWAFGNGVPGMGCLSLIPPVSLAMPFVLGVKGNEWAWRNKRWHSVEHFQSTQRKWTWAGFIVIGLILLLALLMIILAFATAAISVREGSSNSGVLFEDDFSRISSGWPRQNDVEGVAEYTDGGYRLYDPRVGDSSISAAAPRPTDVADVSVEVDAVRIGPTPQEEGGWGVVCRTSGLGVEGYLLLLAGDGRPLIGKRTNEGRVSILAAGDPGDVPNPTSEHRIRGDCVGSSLTLYVDDREVLEASDDEFSSGKVGLTVDSEQDVLFNSFSASRP